MNTKECGWGVFVHQAVCASSFESPIILQFSSDQGGEAEEQNGSFLSCQHCPPLHLITTEMDFLALMLTV